MIELEPYPFVLHGEHTRWVRLYTIGPQHLDWLCVFCGKTGNLDGDRLSRWVLALEQINIAQAIEKCDGVEDSIDRLGNDLAYRRCRRSAHAHLQQHLRFEQICEAAPFTLDDVLSEQANALAVDEPEPDPFDRVEEAYDQWPFDDDPPDPL